MMIAQHQRRKLGPAANAAFARNRGDMASVISQTITKLAQSRVELFYLQIPGRAP